MSSAFLSKSQLLPSCLMAVVQRMSVWSAEPDLTMMLFSKMSSRPPPCMSAEDGPALYSTLPNTCSPLKQSSR